jgi:dihydroorotase
MQELTLIRPDDWHVHFRDGAVLQQTVPATARAFRRAIVMPNLVPPVMDTQQALAYRERLPAGATTNSAQGVTAIERIQGVLETMAEVGMPLLVHGEVTTADIDIFDREQTFIDRILAPLCQRLPQLRLVLEHITTREAAQFVQQAPDNIAATITVQHLLYNRNHMLVGGVRPHLYCLPVLKRNLHQQALQDAVVSGSSKFFLGTDSAPHARHTKEAACGCAGCYSAPAAIELYAEIFEQLGVLDKLEAFASRNGPAFYGLPENTQHITLRREPWQLPADYDFGEQRIVPLKAGETLQWKLVS